MRVCKDAGRKHQQWISGHCVDWRDSRHPFHPKLTGTSTAVILNGLVARTQLEHHIHQANMSGPTSFTPKHTQPITLEQAMQLEVDQLIAGERPHMNIESTLTPFRDIKT